MDINYLLDGVLVQSLERNNLKGKSNLFQGRSYGNVFFIYHTVINGKEDLKSIKDQLKLTENQSHDASKIFILNKSQKTSGINVVKELSSALPQLSFEHLNI